MKNNLARLLPIFLAAIALGAPHMAQAVSSLSGGFSIVPAACNCGAGAGWGCVLQVIGNLLDLAIGIGVLASVAALAYAGFLWVTNPLNSENRTQGRNMLLNAVVGLVIALGAWLIVNTLLNVLTGSGVESATSKLGIGTDCLPTASDVTSNLNVQPTGSTTTGYEPSTPATTGTGNGGYTYDDGIQAQVGDESGALSSLLSCMSGKLPAGVGRISSISDSEITKGQKTFAACAAGGCQHGANSCHYGGRTCIGKSYAVDFGDGDPEHPANLTALTAAANACGANYTTDNEEGKRTHLHVSVGGSCGCN